MRADAPVGVKQMLPSSLLPFPSPTTAALSDMVGGGH